MSKILITGGAGFIGSNFIRYMLGKYNTYKIINVDALTYAGDISNLKDIEDNRNYTFYHGDIRDADTMSSLFKQGIDYVINFAAESHVDRSISSSKDFIETNIMGTQVLLECSRRYGVLKYIQISTDEVYGSLGRVGTFSEDSPLKSNNPYSASKAGADLLVRSYNKTYGLPINITRCSNNYGPYQYPEKLIPLIITRALRNQPLPVYGNGLQIRDWIHVLDHCKAIDMVLHDGAIGEVYNIGTNNEVQNIVLVKSILGILNKPESLIEYVKDRLGHDTRYAIDSSKIKEELGWSPCIDFKSGLKDTVDWYRNRVII